MCPERWDGGGALMGEACWSGVYLESELPIDQENLLARRLLMLSYCASLDASVATVCNVNGWLPIAAPATSASISGASRTRGHVVAVLCGLRAVPMYGPACESRVSVVVPFTTICTRPWRCSRSVDC